MGILLALFILGVLALPAILIIKLLTSSMRDVAKATHPTRPTYRPPTVLHAINPHTGAHEVWELRNEGWVKL